LAMQLNCVVIGRRCLEDMHRIDAYVTTRLLVPVTLCSWFLFLRAFANNLFFLGCHTVLLQSSMPQALIYI